MFDGFAARVTGSSRRSSSWDRTGHNRDWRSVASAATESLFEHDGPGCIRHIYCTMIWPLLTDYRDAILRMYWDGEDAPSVEVPLGDFFGIAHLRVREFTSQLVVVNPGMGGSHGLNVYFPMPFATGARITIEQRGAEPLGRGSFWFHVDWDELAAQPAPMRFHAQYRQERPTTAAVEPANTPHPDALNIGGAGNYLALEATGEGRMVGLLLEIDNHGGDWYGEGDDMVWIDQPADAWPPAIHGTGSEEVFGGGASPVSEWAGPYTGFHFVESADWAGMTAMYRWYVHDPLSFHSSIRWTIEHGHANNYANDYSSVAFWYQSEPHAAFPALPGREALLPRLGAAYDDVLEKIRVLLRTPKDASARGPSFLRELSTAYYGGCWDRVDAILEASGRKVLGSL